MKNMDKIVKSAITGVLTLTAVGAMAATTNKAMSSQSNMEKCYGIVKAGLNDCETSNSSCAGSSKKDAQPDAFLFVPKGTCDKIVNGSLLPITESKK